MFCDLCGKKMKVVEGILGYNTLHECVSGSEVICMYDINNECVYCGLPPELESIEGIKVQRFLKSFLKKEIKSKNPIYIHALRNSTIDRIVNDLFD